MTDTWLAPLEGYEPRVPRRPRTPTPELLLNVTLAEAHLRREGRPESDVLGQTREFLSDLAGVPPAMS